MIMSLSQCQVSNCQCVKELGKQKISSHLTVQHTAISAWGIIAYNIFQQSKMHRQWKMINLISSSFIIPIKASKVDTWITNPNIALKFHLPSFFFFVLWYNGYFRTLRIWMYNKIRHHFAKISKLNSSVQFFILNLLSYFIARATSDVMGKEMLLNKIFLGILLLYKIPSIHLLNMFVKTYIKNPVEKYD